MSKTRRDLPSCARVSTTFRNINWLLQYCTCIPPRHEEEEDVVDGVALAETKECLWDCSVCYPDPVCAEYGFKYRETAGSSRRKKSRTASGGACKKGGGGAVGGGMSAIQWLDEADHCEYGSD